MLMGIKYHKILLTLDVDRDDARTVIDDVDVSRSVFACFRPLVALPTVAGSLTLSVSEFSFSSSVSGFSFRDSLVLAGIGAFLYACH